MRAGAGKHDPFLAGPRDNMSDAGCWRPVVRVDSLRAMKLFRQHKLLRLLALNLAIGTGAAWIFVGAIFLFDIGGVGSLAAAAGARWLAAIILAIVLTITWGSVSMGMAIFLLPKDEDDDSENGGRLIPASALVPVTARSSGSALKATAAVS